MEFSDKMVLEKLGWDVIVGLLHWVEWKGGAPSILHVDGSNRNANQLLW